MPQDEDEPAAFQLVAEPWARPAAAPATKRNAAIAASAAAAIPRDLGIALTQRYDNGLPTDLRRTGQVGALVLVAFDVDVDVEAVAEHGRVRRRSG